MDSPTFDATYFERCYRDYARQNPPRKLRFYRRTIERHLTPDLPRRIHDVGCGLGAFLGALGDSWDIHGSDVSDFAVGQARQRCPRGRFQVAGATDRAVFGGGFGVVTAFDVLEHVRDLDAVAESVQEQLVPGGLFVFAVPVYDGLSGPIIRRLDKDPTHVRTQPRGEWLHWAAARFQVLQWTGLVRYLLGPLGYIHWATRWFRNHTPAILVVCHTRRQGDAP